jgi:hypothetical protein
VPDCAVYFLFSLGTMPVALLEPVEIEEAIAKMDGDLLSQLLKCNVSPLIIATLSKAITPPPCWVFVSGEYLE